MSTGIRAPGGLLQRTGGRILTTVPKIRHRNGGRFAMRKARFLAWITAGAILLSLAFAGLVMAKVDLSSAALTGKVTAQTEGAMEGVIVGAKKAGSTITTWVVSNAQG